MLDQLPLDLVSLIESFVLNEELVKQMSLDFYNYLCEIESYHSFSVWKYRPYWKDYVTYWERRAELLTEMYSIPDLMNMRLLNHATFGCSKKNDLIQYLHTLDKESAKFSVSRTGVFSGLLMNVYYCLEK